MKTLKLNSTRIDIAIVALTILAYIFVPELAFANALGSKLVGIRNELVTIVQNSSGIGAIVGLGLIALGLPGIGRVLFTLGCFGTLGAYLFPVLISGMQQLAS